MKTIYNEQKGFSALEVLVVILIIAVVGLAGMLVHNRQTKSSTASTTSKSSTASKSAAPVATDPYVGWKQYCSGQEKICFKYPTDWTTKSVQSSDSSGGDGVYLMSQAGTTLDFQSAAGGVGGACDATTEPHIFITKVIADPTVTNLYVVETSFQGGNDHIGLVYSAGSAPALGDTGNCLYYTILKSRHDPNVNSWFQSSSANALKTSDLPTAELILKSYTYN